MMKEWGLKDSIAQGRKAVFTLALFSFAISAVSQTNVLDTTFDPGTGTDALVEDVALLPNGKILISGAFTLVDGKQHNHIARLNSNGSVDDTFTGGANDWVRCMAVQSDGKILIGGKFTGVNDVQRDRIARLNSDGTLDTAFDPGAGVQGPFVYPDVPDNIPFVWGIVPQTNGKIMIAGGFTNYNGVARSCVARLNSDGSLDTTFDPGAGTDGWVKSLYVLPDGKIMLAGWFDKYNNQYYPRIVRLLSNGAIDTTFGPLSWGDRSSVYTLDFQPDGKIVFCGHFSFVNGSAHEKVARVFANGTLDESFNCSANDFVEDLKVRSDGKILIGGYFSLVNGESQPQIALLNPDGSVVPGFAPVIDDYVWMMRIQSAGKVVIGGGFHSVDGVSRNGMARLNMPPTSPIAQPIFTSVVKNGAQLVLRGSGGVPGGTYRLLSSTNLSATNWAVMSTNSFDTNGNLSCTNAVNAAARGQFFNVVTP